MNTNPHIVAKPQPQMMAAKERKDRKDEIGFLRVPCVLLRQFFLPFGRPLAQTELAFISGLKFFLLFPDPFHLAFGALVGEAKHYENKSSNKL